MKTKKNLEESYMETDIIALIAQYGITLRTWYTHQASAYLCERVKCLERQCEKIILPSENSGTLHTLLQIEQWSTTYLTPKR